MATWTPIQMTAEESESYDIEGYGMTDFDDDLWYQVASSMPVVAPSLRVSPESPLRVAPDIPSRCKR